MRYLKRFTVFLAVALFILASRTARADEFDQLMVITFSGSVQVPGAVLPAGTYQFKLADPYGDRNVVEIRNADGSKVYATLLTIPDERSTPTDEPVVTFEARIRISRSDPRRLLSWRDDWDRVRVFDRSQIRELAVVGSAEALA